MHFLTVSLIVGILLIVVIKVIDFAISESRWRIAFRGLRLARSYRTPCHLMGKSPLPVESFSTALCVCRVDSPREIRFRAKRGLFGLGMSWPFRGRIVADGGSWLVEVRMSLLLTVEMVYALVFWIIVVWATIELDGPVAGLPWLAVGGLFFLVWRRWYRHHLKTTDEMVTNIAATLAHNTDLGWSQVA